MRMGKALPTAPTGVRSAGRTSRPTPTGFPIGTRTRTGIRISTRMPIPVRMGTRTPAAVRTPAGMTMKT